MAGTRKTAAILVADVVGYSRLAGADEDRTLSRLRGLRSDLIDPAIDAHRGRGPTMNLKTWSISCSLTAAATKSRMRRTIAAHAGFGWPRTLAGDRPSGNGRRNRNGPWPA